MKRYRVKHYTLLDGCLYPTVCDMEGNILYYCTNSPIFEYTDARGMHIKIVSPGELSEKH
jgi:hypothetical protein